MNWKRSWCDMPKAATMRLPKADDFSSYWLNGRGHAPAILSSATGGFFATLEDGPIVEGRSLRKFRTPTEALAAIEAAMRS